MYIFHDGKVHLLLLCMHGIFALWISVVPSDEKMLDGKGRVQMVFSLGKWYNYCLSFDLFIIMPNHEKTNELLIHDYIWYGETNENKAYYLLVVTKEKVKSNCK